MKSTSSRSTAIMIFAAAAIFALLCAHRAAAQSPAARSKPTPTPTPLTQVSTDSTLTGDGTPASPLGLSDGAVTAAKFNTPAPPASGQVLTYSGGGLSWQGPTGGALRVVDDEACARRIADAATVTSAGGPRRLPGPPVPQHGMPARGPVVVSWR